MSEQNVEIVRRLYRRVLAADRTFDPATADVLPEFFHPDVHVRQMSEIIGTIGDFYGYEGIAASAAEMAGALSELAFVPEELHAGGDKVVAIASAHGTGRASGATVEWHGAHLFTLRHGRVIGWEVFDNPRDALEAARLPE
jgi:ketosteroid isomerase-like protein